MLSPARLYSRPIGTLFARAMVIAAMNSDFKTKKIRILKERCGPLIEEWNTLVWDEKKRAKGEFKELASKNNHAADAALYVHHFSRHYRATPEPPPDGRNDMRKTTEARIERQKRQEAESNFADVEDFYDKAGR